MNKSILVGRLTRDPDIRYTDGGLSIARINVAVDRRFKKDGEQQADFIPCLAFGKTAEHIEKYFSKGQKIGLTGRIQTGSFTNKDGQKVYTTEVLIEEVEFVESKGNQKEESNSNNSSNQSSNGEGWMNIPDGIDEGLPFN